MNLSPDVDKSGTQIRDLVMDSDVSTQAVATAKTGMQWVEQAAVHGGGDRMKFKVVPSAGRSRPVSSGRHF